MKTALSLLLALAAVVSQATVSNPGWKQGLRYQFGYKAQSVSGIPLLSNDRNGLALWSRAHLYFHTDSSVFLQLEDVELRQIEVADSDDVISVERIPDMVEVTDLYRELPQDVKDRLLHFLRLPVSFTLTSRGLVRDILAEDTEPEWSINMKRAVINLFQAQYTDKVQHFLEDTIIGEDCKVHYDIQPVTQSNTRNLTKVFNECRTTSSFRDVIGLGGVQKDRRDDVMTNSYVIKCEVEEYNRRFAPTTCVSEGRHTMRPFEADQGEIITYTRQELVLERVEPKKPIVQPTNQIKRSSTLFAPLTNPANPTTDLYTDIVSETEKVQMIKSLFSRVVGRVLSDIKPEFDFGMPEEILHATKLMRSLTNKDSIMEIVRFCMQPTQQEKMRDTLVSTLSFCGSPAVIDALPELRKELTEAEWTRVIASLPITHQPTQETIFQLMKLYEDCKEETTCRQILLVIGSQVHDICFVKPENARLTKYPVCDSKLKTRVTKFFEEKYMTESETRKLVVLKSIGNSGLDMIKFLSQILRSTSTKPELRVNAIYAMRRMQDKKLLRESLVPVFRNEKDLFTPELRMAAFNILIGQIPTEEMLNVLVSRMNEEKCRQVGNYVYSYLDNLIKIPTVFQASKNLTVAAQNLIPTVKRFEDGLWFSRNVNYILQTISHRMVEYFEMNFINVPQQALPRSFNLRMFSKFCGYYVNLMEVGFRFEGLDNLFYDWFVNFSSQSDVINHLIGDRFKRDLEHIQSILTEEVTPRPVEKSRGYIFLKYLGAELGVFTTDDYSIAEMKQWAKDVTQWDATVEYFNVMPVGQAVIKVQSLVGMPVVVDWASVSMTHVHSEMLLNKENIIYRTITPRFLLKSFVRVGLDFGLMKTSVGQCSHILTELPLKVLINYEQPGQLTLQLTLDTESPLLTREQTLIDVSSVPLSLTEMIDLTDHTFKYTYRRLYTHPIFNPHKFEREMEGFYYNYETTSQALAWKAPLFPIHGKHIFQIIWKNDVPIKPFGFKTVFTYDPKEYTYTGIYTLNPEIEDCKYELRTALLIKKTEPMITLEVEPKWMGETLRFFFTVNKISGEINRRLSWINAAEDKPIEYEIRSQWGWNQIHDKDTEDLIVKVNLKKSPLQKFFEVEDEMSRDSDCHKCEKERPEFRTLHCDRCLYKRSLITREDMTVFLNKDKMPKTGYWMPLTSYFLVPYYNYWESETLKEPIMTSLVSQHPQLLSSMSHVPTKDVLGLRLVKDCNPYFTEFNTTVYYDVYKLPFTGMPLVPAWRRMDNLPSKYFTDVFSDRLTLEHFGYCTLDMKDRVKTLDNVRYDLPKREYECERVLLRDCTEQGSLEVTTTLLPTERRTLKIVINGEKLEIVPMKTPSTTTYEVRVNNKIMQFESGRIVTPKFTVERITVVDPENVNQHKIIATINNQWINFTLFQDFVDVRMPFWYRGKVCGLCGDYIGEFKREFVLPSGEVATSIDQFVTAYTAGTCEQVNTRQ